MGNWQAFIAVVRYNEDLTVWAATTLVNGEDGKKFNLLWLLLRNHEGPGGRDEMDMDIFLLLDPVADRNCVFFVSKAFGGVFKVLVGDEISRYESGMSPVRLKSNCSKSLE